MLEVKEATGQDVYLEYMFHPTRRWRFDACVPSVMVAVEVEGMAGRSGKSRHMTYGGYQKDMEKYNAATALGWHLLRFTWKDVRDGSAGKQIVESVRSFA
jgi:very-short-patch-repair endonuclease